MTDPSQDSLETTWKRLASRRLLTHAVAHNGGTRDALVYLPQHVRRRRGLPLVLVLHGGGSSPETIARRSAMHRRAEEAGFIVAYPRGTRQGGKDFTWNPAGSKAARKENDTRFLHALVADLRRRYEIDADRIYAAGFSVGGSLVYELAALMNDRLAAVAVVAGTMTATFGEPVHPLPLIHIHGTADRRVPLKGGRGAATRRPGEWAPVQDGIDRWRAINGCTAPAQVVRRSLEGVTVHRYAGLADVELWLVEGGAHVWPGAQYSISDSERARPADVFSATEAIWGFFTAHPRRRGIGGGERLPLDLASKS